MKTRKQTYASIPENLSQVVDDAEAVLKEVYEDEDFIYKVMLLVSEAATNAMEHGNKFDAAKDIVVELELQEEQATILVTDEGDGFSEEAVDDPLKKANLMNDGGRGIFLMEALAAEVRFEEGGQKVVLVVQPD